MVSPGGAAVNSLGRKPQGPGATTRGKPRRGDRTKLQAPHSYGESGFTTLPMNTPLPYVPASTVRGSEGWTDRE